MELFPNVERVIELTKRSRSYRQQLLLFLDARVLIKSRFPAPNMKFRV
jgi:hypothetical protein